MDGVWAAVIGALVGVTAAFAVNVWWSRRNAPRALWYPVVDEYRRLDDGEIEVSFRLVNCGTVGAFAIEVFGFETTSFQTPTFDLVPLCAPGQYVVPLDWSGDRRPPPFVARFRSIEAGVEVHWNGDLPTRRQLEEVRRFIVYLPRGTIDGDEKFWNLFSRG